MPVAVLIARMVRRLRRRKSLGFGLVLLAVLVSLLGNAACFWVFDGPSAGLSFEDAVWYSVISITTIGYGDYSASSLGARLGTLVFIVGIGLSSFTVFLGMLVDWGMELAMRGLEASLEDKTYNVLQIAETNPVLGPAYGNYHELLKKIKEALDPQNIANPPNPIQVS